MTTAQRHLKILYWKRVLAWNRRRLKGAKGAARKRYTDRIAEAEKRIHDLVHPPKPPAPKAATGPDVSNLQASVDFAQIKAAGHAFVYLKAGEGDWTDPTFLARVKAARHAGLLVGAYHFVRPKAGRTGAQEAAFFVHRLQAAGLGKGDLRPAVDIEATELSIAGTRDYTLAFAREVQKLMGVAPLIYTYASFNGGNWGAGFAPFGLWIAAYQAKPPTLPAPWTSYAAWQFTSSAQVPGVGKCDVSRTDDIARLIA